MYQCVLEFEALFKRPRRMLWSHHRLPLPRAGNLWAACPGPATSTSLTVGHIDRRAHHFLSDLVAACVFPLTLRFWSGSDSDVIAPDDILALDAAFYMFIQLHLSPQQWYPRTLPELLAAVAALLTRQQPGDVPALHNAYTIQQVARVEFRMLEQLGL